MGFSPCGPRSGLVSSRRDAGVDIHFGSPFLSVSASLREMIPIAAGGKRGHSAFWSKTQSVDRADGRREKLNVPLFCFYSCARFPLRLDSG